MKNLTLIIPAKQESECLPDVLNEIINFNLNCKIKICLDSNDTETIDAIKNYNVEIYAQKNLGYGSALIEGIESNNTDFFCIFNADGSFKPSELAKMHNKIEEENCDFIFGSRYLKYAGSEDDTIVTFVGNKIFSLFGKIFFKLKNSDILFTYVMGKTSKFKELNMKSRDFRFCVELPIKAKNKNFNIEEIGSYERPRISGRKKVSAIRDGWLILIEMVN
jgi:glycosyltransferase involved in cell wall biosynthesis